MISEGKDSIPADAASHYDYLKYLPPWRMAAIGYQTCLIRELVDKGRVLEVGVGTGLSIYMMRNMGLVVDSLDIDPRLQPTYVASITDSKLASASYDAFGCCQVLEHIPFSEVDQALSELHRIVQTGGVVSVPTTRETWLLTRFDGRSWGTRRLPLRLRRSGAMRWPQEHHWELEANVSTVEFRKRLQRAGFVVEREMQPVECLYHHFFLLRKAQDGRRDCSHGVTQVTT